MAVKICLDAGHYGKYNRSPANRAYYESDMVWKLHLLLKRYMEQLGIVVITTRPNQDTNRNLYDRGAASKGCDLFLSMHSNAVGSGVNDTIDYPVAYAAVNGKADEIAMLLTECVQKIMGTSQNARIEHRVSSSGSDYYGVVRGATAVGTPGLILEHSFHTNTRITNWLLNDSNLEKLAQAEAKVIAEYFGIAAGDGDPDQDVIPLNGYVKVTYDGEDGLNVRTEPKMGDEYIDHVVYGGVYTVVGITENREWYKLKSGLYITANARFVSFSTSLPSSEPEGPFSVRVEIDDLRIRTGPGTNYEDTDEYTGIGTFTIMEVQPGEGADAGWGRLMSGAGWIALDYAERI